MHVQHQHHYPQQHNRGFALIATVSVMTLLAMIALAMLSLGVIETRSSDANKHQEIAKANARMAMMIALAELQETIGDDRRITADGSIFEDAQRPHLVGAWESWSPDMIDVPTRLAPDYDQEKENRFLRWFVSGDLADRTRSDWVKDPATGADLLELFTEDADGFSIQAQQVATNQANSRGNYAWAVSQEASKAKITVAGPELADREANDDLQVQPRPSLANSQFLEQPQDGWNERASKVIGDNQVQLDQDLWKNANSRLAGAHFTTKGAGLLTNVVNGGLKVDLNLGFEMEDGEFNRISWNDADGGTIPNPFHGANMTGVTVPESYQGQRPLYRPLADDGAYQRLGRTFPPCNMYYQFPVETVPTFHSLRSYCRIPYHLYQTADGVTAFERPRDHVAGGRVGPEVNGLYPPPGKTVDGDKTQMGLRPVLDRAMYVISAGLSKEIGPSGSKELRLVVTPIITLWNPHNVALEVEGAVSYIWLDIGFDMQWIRLFGQGGVAQDKMLISSCLSQQFLGVGHYRSVNPYFYAAITEDGQPISGSGSKPIRFQPGEVRVFMPAQQEAKEYVTNGTIRDRTVFLRPVTDISQFSPKGGLAIPTVNSITPNGPHGKRLPLNQGDRVQLSFTSREDSQDFPFNIALEDATRAKGSNPTHDDRGQEITGVNSEYFSMTGDLDRFSSAILTYDQLEEEPQPIGVLETYHQVAKSGAQAEKADLVYTGNPRQPWMNPLVTNTTFKTGTQYKTRMRQVADLSEVIQTTPNGRSAYYGASQSIGGGGKTHLPFFEVPRAPILSMAALQHGDFSATSYAPANQIGNSWASAFVPRAKAGERASGNIRDGAPSEVDHCYLLNEALWDGYFFSGAAPTVFHEPNTGSPAVWDSKIAGIQRSTKNLLKDFFEDPVANPLRNPRMRPLRTITDTSSIDDFIRPEACVKIAADLMVDGAFNVNSTSVEAWAALLSGLRNSSFLVDGNTTDITGGTPFPRFRDPLGTENDNWNGFRVLSDNEILELAEEIVEEVRARGPFQSLGEFVNRRIAGDELGAKGALQAAIDRSGINAGAMMDPIDTAQYEANSRDNISPANTGVGIPGYLTQADLLKPIAPVITVRSDTFTIRAYGDSRDANGRILAKAVVEATVQRYPEFVDKADPAHTPVADLNPVNQKFGRKFKIVSYRYLPSSEIFDTTSP